MSSAFKMRIEFLLESRPPVTAGPNHSAERRPPTGPGESLATTEFGGAPAILPRPSAVVDRSGPARVICDPPTGWNNPDRPRNFKCKICTYPFTKKEHLKRHVILVHRRIRPFKCLYCRRDFGTKQNQVTHFETKRHKEVVLHKIESGIYYEWVGFFQHVSSRYRRFLLLISMQFWAACTACRFLPSSLRHRSHLSTTRNVLVNKGDMSWRAFVLFLFVLIDTSPIEDRGQSFRRCSNTTGQNKLVSTAWNVEFTLSLSLPAFSRFLITVRALLSSF